MLSSLHVVGSSSPCATAGFNLLSEKIRAVHCAINPGIISSDTNKLEQSAVNAAAAVGRKVKSSFTEGLGKRKMVEDIGDSLSTLTLSDTQHGGIMWLIFKYT